MRQAGYGVYWAGRSSSSSWHIDDQDPQLTTLLDTGGFHHTCTSTHIMSTFDTEFVNGQYSPNIWPFNLQVFVYFAF